MLSLASHAQMVKMGFHGAIGGARMTLSENTLNDQVFVRQGPLMPTVTFGIQSLITKSRDYPSRWLQWNKSVLFEANLCRCGGNIDLITTLPSGSKTFDGLRYIQYQGNFSAKILLGLNKLQFLIGPNISSNFYSGVQLNGSDEHKSAKSQFNPIAIGYEGGVGIFAGKLLTTLRFRGYFSKYGKETTLIPTEFGNTQIMFMISYFVRERNREKNHDSIFWD